MVPNVDRVELQALFLEALRGAEYSLLEGINPFRIRLFGKEYWIYIKNLTSAHFENPDVWRAQLPFRTDFEEIRNSNHDFILLGYDGENDVYATWMPRWVKQRLNSTENVSCYSRLSLQRQARKKMLFEHMILNNEVEVVAFPRELLPAFFSQIETLFNAEGDYVAIGSKRRPEANESFKVFTTNSNVDDYGFYLSQKGFSKEESTRISGVLKCVLSDGTITRNRKLFYAYDSLQEYSYAVRKLVTLDEVTERGDAYRALLFSALSGYLDYLINQKLNRSGEDSCSYDDLSSADNDFRPFEVLSTDVDSAKSSEELFAYFSSESTIQAYQKYLIAKNYTSRVVDLYPKTIRNMLQNGMISRYKHLFLRCGSYEEYKTAYNYLFEITWIIVLNNLVHRFYSASLMKYINFLCDSNPEAPQRLEQNSCTEVQQNNGVVGEKTVHDWEGEYTDTYGKLTRIANPELINRLRPYLDTSLKKPISAYNTIGDFYGERYSDTMSFKDWQKLLDAIDWSNPYVHDAPDSKSQACSDNRDSNRRKKTHILRVEFPDGEVIQEKIVSDTLVKAIKKIDPGIVEMVKISHCGVDLVSKTLDSKYGTYQKDAGDGWFVMTNTSTEDKCADLQKISDVWDLGLRVSLIPIEQSSSSTVHHSLEQKHGKRTKIRVTFPDGRAICPNQVMNALLEVVQYAGAIRVWELNIRCLNDNLILRAPMPRYELHCKSVGDGWFCNTMSSTEAKFAQINDISDRLNLNLEVELV